MAAMAAVSSSVSPSKAPVLLSPARFQTTFAKTSFGKEARQVVLNVYYKLRCESPNESYKAIVQRTSELTRVGYSTIFRWKKLVQSSPDGTPSVPSPKRKRKRSAPPTPSLLDSFDRGTLRLIVHDFFRRNECPTLSKNAMCFLCEKQGHFALVAPVVKHSQQPSLTMNGKHHFQSGVEANPGAVDNLPDATRVAVFINETARPMWELSTRKSRRV
ncbi:hypothetical protein HPB47_002604 [Ixodes persulcatus]|uniref:Uncharacterized protein n=1 Tax=Ixodes persulcatus TaxID=34615 RepID=A0AC60PKR2_IXOPE|nr:hypothetical protein HPB47_002604 [Ixodes persulcatus]